MMLLAEQAALVEALLGWRNIEGWVFIEEIDGLHVDLQDLAWHYWEVLHPVSTGL